MKHEAIKKAAESLAEGDSTRITHAGCSNSGDSTNLSITRKSDGLVHYCFKCLKGGFIPDAGYYTPTKVVHTPAPRHIPAMATNDHMMWDPSVRDWLLTYLSLAQIGHRGLLVYKKVLYVPMGAGKFLYRSFDPDWTGPKWCSVGAPQYYFTSNKPPSFVLLVEDCISSIVASGSPGCDAYALLGTSMAPSLRTALLRGGYQVAYIWLDNDNSQVRTNVNKVANQLQLFIREVHIVRTEVDPKSVTSLSDRMDILRIAHDRT